MPDSNENLAKLTIPQLKAICKENGIKVSSKLNKDAIIRAIASTGKVESLFENKKARSTQEPASNASIDTEPQETSRTRPSISAGSSTTPKSLARKRKAADNDEQPKKYKANDTPRVQIEGRNVSNVASFPNHMPAGTGAPDDLRRFAKAPSSDHDADANRTQEAAAFVPATVNLERHAVAQTVVSTHSSDLDSIQVKRAMASRRFIPLPPKCAERPTGSKRHLPGISTSLTDGTTSTATLIYLDFPPVCDVMQLQPLPLPPSLFRRRDVERLALVFAFVSLRDLYQLSQVSRLFRCAVYISAAKLLEWEFSGRRLALLTRLYDCNVTNMWPYLRRRQKERFNCQNTYAQSFLSKVFAGKQMISDRLWASPDHGKQATVAVRFLLTRLFFHVSVGHTINHNMRIMEAQELVKGEIWSIETSTEGRVEVFYILEATCEVIGQQPPFYETGVVPCGAIPLRVDWSEYINQHASRSSRTACQLSLIGNLKWTNHEEYCQGISKLWLSRTQTEGDIGAAKRLVAGRYILACVVGNSISGQWMSSTKMAQEFNGLPDKAYSMNDRRNPTLNLFLPAHHHVESVHFTTSSHEPLHPGLAVIQTPEREYYILRDNGMEVGCEESGVAFVWTQLLGCDTSGRPANAHQGV